MTLRQILDIPPSIHGKIRFHSSFDDQRLIVDLVDTDINIDSKINITLKPMEVIVLEGSDPDRKQNRTKDSSNKKKKKEATPLKL